LAQPTTTFLDELIAAARGCIALLLGRREAPSYFDFSQRGLVGSFIALLIAITFNGVLSTLAAPPELPSSISLSILLGLAAYVGQAGAAWLALRQMGRQDGFVPYIVASNWVALAIIVLLLMSMALGPLGIVILAVVFVLALASFINIGRFIVTLTPLQIGLLFLAEAAGFFVMLTIIAVMLPIPVSPAV
jgi:hypothetical protein